MLGGCFFPQVFLQCMRVGQLEPQNKNALPVPLLRQVSWRPFFGVFFRVRFWEASWSALCSLWEPRGAKSEHFGCQKVPKKCQKSDFLQNQGKLIWSGKYHTILRVGPSKKALKTTQTCDLLHKPPHLRKHSLVTR